MRKAIEEVITGQLTAGKAATKYNVPSRTLYDQVSKLRRSSPYGPPQTEPMDLSMRKKNSCIIKTEQQVDKHLPGNPDCHQAVADR